MTYTPGEQPDPAFKAFFHGEWKALVEAVNVPGMTFASWDRKAAYLLWDYAHSQDHFAEWRAGIVADETAPPQRARMLDSAEARAKAAFGMPISVGTDVNPDEDAACLPSPEGVPLAFDSAKYEW